MRHRDVFIKAALALVLVWGCVWSVRAYAGSKKITSARVNRAIANAKFTDGSGEPSSLSAAELRRREEELRKIADMINRLDFQEREKNRQNRVGEEFFRKLTAGEKNQFIELTIVESMSRFMESLDTMKPEQRQKFVTQALKDLNEGRTQAEMERTDKLGTELLDQISQQGMKAYFEKSSADTKLDLAPLMEAMNEAMQGLRGNEFGPRP
jgi:hypothetical protein